MGFSCFPGGAAFNNMYDGMYMYYIDPNIQNLQQSFKEGLATLPLGPSNYVPNHGAGRPALSVSPAPASHARYGSPSSSSELSPPRAEHSPPADTESYCDPIYPSTPPDMTLRSPSSQPLPMESLARTVQHSGAGLGYVNLSDVSPGQQLSDNESFDLSPSPQPGYFGGHAIPSVFPVVPEPEFFGTQPGIGQIQLPHQSVVKGQIKEEENPYPPLEDSTRPERQTVPKRQQQHDNGGGDDDDDGSGGVQRRPSKRQRTSPRMPEGHMARTITATATSAPLTRTTRTRAGSSIPPRNNGSSSLPSGRARLACPDCKQRAFASQADLDSHIKKEHRRPFSCVFDFAGCNSTFSSKNEWKRHVATQHLLLNYWVCTEGVCANISQESPSSSSPSSPQQHHYLHHQYGTATTAEDTEKPRGAIFNRKDLFTQHLKRMHAPKEIKELLPPAASKRSSTSSSGRGGGGAGANNNNNKITAAQEKALLAQWNARVKRLQEKAIRPRCQLPTFMRCPFPGCNAAPFRGNDAWNRRMEHVAKHMNANNNNNNNNNDSDSDNDANKSGGGGSAARFPAPSSPGPDPTLIEWASRPDVAIIVPDNHGGWELKSPLERKPGGSVVVTAPAGHHHHHDVASSSRSVVVGGGEQEDEEQEVMDDDYFCGGDSPVTEEEDERTVVVRGLEDQQVEDDEADMDAEGEEDDE
ncbi:hypothetical protein VTH82DRAFT_1845 [Thermothelomyces myriococcoides]